MNINNLREGVGTFASHTSSNTDQSCQSKQLIEDKRTHIVMIPGSPAKHDYEYKRNGTRNIFVAVEPKGGNRIISVTQTRTKNDFAKLCQSSEKGI